MNSSEIPKQMLDFNKTTVENTLKAMLVLHNQNQRVTSDLIEKAAWLPEEGKKAITDWMNSYKKGIEDFKIISDEGFKMISNFMAAGEESLSRDRKLQ